MDKPKLWWLSYAFPDETIGVVIIPADTDDEAVKIVRARELAPKWRKGDKRMMQVGVVEVPEFARGLISDNDIGVFLDPRRARAVAGHCSKPAS